LLAGNSGNTSITIYGATNYRWHTFFPNNADTTDILIDGVVTTNEMVNSSQVSGYGSLLKSDMGSLGVHTIMFRRGDVLSNSTFYHYGIDYNTPTYEPANWKTNPYLDYLVGSNSIGNNLQIGATKLVDTTREYYVESTVGDSIGLTTTNLLLARVVLDAGTWEITSQNNILMQLGNNSSAYNYSRELLLDGTSVMKHYSRIMYSDRRRDTSTINVTLTKRSSINLVLSADGSGAYNYEYINSSYPNMRANIIAKKISN
jgi:hypothetical protein